MQSSAPGTAREQKPLDPRGLIPLLPAPQRSGATLTHGEGFTMRGPEEPQRALPSPQSLATPGFNAGPGFQYRTPEPPVPILGKNGDPYMTQKSAALAARMRPDLKGRDLEATPVKGGWGLIERAAPAQQFRPTEPIGEGAPQSPIVVTPPEPTEAASELKFAISPEIRRQGVPPEAGKIISSYRDAAALKTHPDYLAAKGGDIQAATRFVSDMVNPQTIQEARERFGSDATYVPVRSEEASGHNRIPVAMAELYAAHSGGHVDDGIFQANRSYHTGSRPMERIASHALFEGAVQRGGRYVLVDDVSTLGSTFADLADYIQSHGGKVEGLVALANANRTDDISPSSIHQRLIERRFGNVVRQELGVDPGALTRGEAAYLAGYRDADALRDGIVKARDARSARLRAKGIRPSETEEQGRIEPPREADKDGKLSVAETAPQKRKLAGVRVNIGEESFAARHAAASEARQRLDRMGLGDIGIRIADTIRGIDETGKPILKAGGQYDPARKVITLSLEDDWRATLGHEAIHALRDLRLFTKTEWSFLRAKAIKNWRAQYDIDSRYAQLSEEKRNEEAVAEAFAAWPAQGAPKTIIARIFDKVSNALSAIRSALRGHGFRTANDLFGDIEAGKIGARPRGLEASAPPYQRPSRFMAPSEAGVLQDITREARSLVAADASAQGKNAAIRDYLIDRGQHRGTEALVAYDAKTNDVIDGSTLNDSRKVNFSDWLRNRLADPRQRIILHHNHPDGSALSDADIMTTAFPGLRAIIAHGADSNFYSAALEPDVARLVPDEARFEMLRRLLNVVEKRMISVFRPLIRGGTIDEALANRYYWHMHAEALHRAGVMEFQTSAKVPDKLNEIAERDVYPQAAEEIRSILNEYSRWSPGRIHRPTEPIRAGAGIARLLGEPEERQAGANGDAGEASGARGPQGGRGAGETEGLESKSFQLGRSDDESEERRPGIGHNRPPSPIGTSIDSPDPRVIKILQNATLPLLSRLKNLSPDAIRDEVDLWKTRLSDYFLPVLRAQQAVEKLLGRPLSERENPYLAAEI